MVYGTEFDSPLHIPVPTFDWDKNVVVFGENKRSLVHIYNKKNYIFILGKDPTQELDNTTIGTKAEHSINFWITERSIFSNSALKWKKQSFICQYDKKYINFKAKISKKPISLVFRK